ncbi:ParB/RepB/Spo0J family partition protein [Flindersiella endophytica]
MYARLAASENLRRRRLEMLPLRGPGAVFTEPQGRTPGQSSAPEDLADLISSIGTVGLLQPVLVEEFVDGGGDERRRLRLVSGDRRLRAMRWGAIHDADNPQFAALPAVVCPGPLTDADRRCWQLVENVAREDLRPGELAAALLLERCAIATARLLAAGRTPLDEVMTLEDPVEQWRAIERFRGHDAECAAPWSEVLRRLGLQLSPRKARQLAQAFAALPREISEEMDEAKVSLHTRITFAGLLQGRRAAAEEIWTAVKQRQRTDLLSAAVKAGAENSSLGAEQAVQMAEKIHAGANEARAEKLRRSDQIENDSRVVSVDVVTAVLDSCRCLAAGLRDGGTMPRYAAGSLRLLIDELSELLAGDQRPGMS